MNPASSLPPSKLFPTLLEKLGGVPPHDPERVETTDGYDNPACTNRMRANFPIEALAVYQKVCRMNEENHIAAADLICDLLHLVHSQDQSPKEVLETALTNFLAEAE